MDHHPHDPRTDKARKQLGQAFGQLMDRTVMHVRCDYRDQRQWLKVIGTVQELHGPHGQCSCCPRQVRRTVDGDVVGHA